MPVFKFCACMVASLLLAGCASYIPNEPLDTIDPKSGYRFDTLDAGDNSEELFVVLSFSGGGTRAAALSYGVMERLRDTQIEWNGRQKSLLSEVDVISSVSGGSFTAAYYGLNRDKFFLPKPDENGFEARFLYKDIEQELLSSLFSPLNWARLASSTFGRIDLAAEIYQKQIFGNGNFNDLAKGGRPFIIMNATDMSQGAPFSFIQSQFDFLCSDLGSYPVAKAVAASSNFPIAFTPLTINNYSQDCEMEKKKWIRLAEKDADFSVNPRRSARARIAWSYRDPERQYVHLLDGGVADNIGLRQPLTSIRSGDPSWSILNRINQGKIKKLVVIVVDAKTRPQSDIDEDASPPGLFNVIENIATTPLDNYSFDTVELLHNTFEQWRKDRRNLWIKRQDAFRFCPPPPDNPNGPDIKPLDLYEIYVGFDQIADKADREKFLNMPTTFYLPDEDIGDLRKIGKDLMSESRPYSALVDCIKPG